MLKIYQGEQIKRVFGIKYGTDMVDIQQTFSDVQFFIVSAYRNVVKFSLAANADPKFIRLTVDPNNVGYLQYTIPKEITSVLNPNCEYTTEVRLFDLNGDIIPGSMRQKIIVERMLNR